MTGYALTQQAKRDIDEIAAYISAENPLAASRFVQTIYETFELIASMPGIGHGRSDLTDRPLKFMTVRKRYVVIYRSSDRPIRIVRVLSRYRDVKSMLR